jgi:hypothetical protein
MAGVKHQATVSAPLAATLPAKSLTASRIWPCERSAAVETSKPESVSICVTALASLAGLGSAGTER